MSEVKGQGHKNNVLPKAVRIHHGLYVEKVCFPPQTDIKGISVQCISTTLVQYKGLSLQFTSHPFTQGIMYKANSKG